MGHLFAWVIKIKRMHEIWTGIVNGRWKKGEGGKREAGGGRGAGEGERRKGAGVGGGAEGEETTFGNRYGGAAAEIGKASRVGWAWIRMEP